MRFQSIDIHCRLLPLQILGKQASNTAFKAKSCLRMMSLESNTELARARVRSLLSDFGTESNLWTIPDISAPQTDKDEEQRGSLCFPRSMPLADIDHLMHKVMLQGEEFMSQDNPLWPDFEHQIHALAKFFSKKDHVEQYVQRHIYQNIRIPDHAKKSLARMFDTTCPTFCVTRWHFGFEVMHWVSKREALIKYLEPLSAEDLSNDERSAIKSLGSDRVGRVKFWAIFWCFYASRAKLKLVFLSV